MPLKRLLLIIILFCSLQTLSQEPPFYKDVQHFKKLDSAHPPVKNGILFIGSSSFTNWKDVQKYFPELPIINRAFGGSSLPDLIRYADDIIDPYAPKEILIYCGENDFAGSDSLQVTTLFGRFKTLHEIIRSKLPKTKIGYVSMKPSISRRSLFPKFMEANELIREFLNAQPNCYYIDVYSKMLDEKGQPFKEIFLSDSLHMNEKGYAIWKKAFDSKINQP